MSFDPRRTAALDLAVSSGNGRYASVRDAIRLTA